MRGPSDLKILFQKEMRGIIVITQEKEEIQKLI